MIAITNVAALLAIPSDDPPQNVELTATVIDSKITGAVVIDATITTALNTMLKSIIGNSDVTTIAKNKIAEYSGFSIDDSSGSNVLTFKANDVSLDKLTFYVMFRLPYTHKDLTYEDIGDGNTATSIGSNPTAWGKYANHIRAMSGSDLKKINSAGEQVNSQGKPVDDNDDEIDGWYSEKAYNYLGEKPFSNETLTVPSGLNSTATEKAMMFGQNDEDANGTGVSALDITKIPIYFYQLSVVENPYSTTYWLKSTKDSITISRLLHWPATVSTNDHLKHFAKISSNEDNATVSNGTHDLEQDDTGSYVKVGTKKVYFIPLDNASVDYDGVKLKDANKLVKNSDGYLAMWESVQDQPKLNNNSGLTFGMGVDLGATFRGFYEIEINISFSGTGTFRLYSGPKRSSELSTAISAKDLKTAVLDLLDLKSLKSRVTVKDSTGKNQDHPSVGTPAKITILRQASQDPGSTQKAYNHRIYVSDTSSGVSVSLTPDDEDERWKVASGRENEEEYFLNRILNYSFTNDPGSDDEYWLSQIDDVKDDDDKQDELKLALKKAIGCRSKSGYNNWHQKKDQIKKIELKSYVRNLRAIYHKFFIDRFYNKKRKLKNNSELFNGKSGNDSVQYLLDKLEVKPNQAELFAIVLLNYNYPKKYRSRHSDLIKAINEHSITKIKYAIRGLDDGRIGALNNFIGPSVKSKLYHGLDD